MTTTNTIRFDISAGPSADRVIDALKYAFSKADDKISAEFLVRDSRLRGSLSWHKIEAQIVGVQYESGTSGMFILSVNIPGFTTSSGFYNANQRTGHFDLER